MRLRPAPANENYDLTEYQQKCIIFKRSILAHIDAGTDIIYCDECCFTWRGYQPFSWAPKGQSLELKKKANKYGVNCCACVGAISLSRGKEAFMYVEKALDANQFIEFMRYLHGVRQGRKPYIIVVDGASIHWTKLCKEEAAMLGITLVKNIPYMPDTNGIEMFWARAKVLYKAIGTQVLVRGD